jgi:hypothetical protein
MIFFDAVSDDELVKSLKMPHWGRLRKKLSRLSPGQAPARRKGRGLV